MHKNPSQDSGMQFSNTNEQVILSFMVTEKLNTHLKSVKTPVKFTINLQKQETKVWSIKNIIVKTIM